MTGIVTVCGFSVLCVCAALILKQLRSDVALILGVCASAAVIVYSLTEIGDTVAFLLSFSEKNGAGTYASVMVKSLAVACMTNVTSDICRDAGEFSTASRLETAGKCTIVALSLPLLRSLLTTADQLMS